MKSWLFWSALGFAVGTIGCSVDNDSSEEEGSAANADSDTGADTETDNANGDGSDGGSDGDGGEEGDGEDVWAPKPGTTWQWQLTEVIDDTIEVEMYDVDLYETPKALFEELQGKGRIVICYFSAGSWEEWRQDADNFPSETLGKALEGWPDEKWVDVRSDAVRAIMETRLDFAVEKGCDGVEPDNVDGYANDNGLGLTAADQLEFNRFLAREAHERGLSVGLKNDLDQIPALVDSFDWALNEECLAYSECDALQPFLDQGKAVFHVEYVDEISQGAGSQKEVCKAAPDGFSTLIKLWDVDAWYLDCL